MFPTLNLDTLVSSINQQIEKENSHEIGKVILLTFNSRNEASVVLENVFILKRKQKDFLRKVKIKSRNLK